MGRWRLNPSWGYRRRRWRTRRRTRRRISFINGIKKNLRRWTRRPSILPLRSRREISPVKTIVFRLSAPAAYLAWTREGDVFTTFLAEVDPRRCKRVVICVPLTPIRGANPFLCAVVLVWTENLAAARAVFIMATPVIRAHCQLAGAFEAIGEIHCTL